ncbi:hypothetical protein E5349_12095 [Enterococcus faecalis]|nr:hypothetical protein E5349_12095 [Enterococcus faecalis]
MALLHSKCPSFGFSCEGIYEEIELNKISYNGRTPVYDLRSWSPDGRMGKGMTLTDQTLENLLIVLKAHLEGEFPEEEKETESELEARLPQDFE